MSGTTGPVITRARDEPDETIPEAMPRRLTSNQADMRATDGTRTPPPPRPVMSLPSEAVTMPVESPVRSIPAAATTEPIATTLRGPNREARRPPMVAMIT